LYCILRGSQRERYGEKWGSPVNLKLKDIIKAGKKARPEKEKGKRQWYQGQRKASLTQMF